MTCSKLAIAHEEFSALLLTLIVSMIFFSLVHGLGWMSFSSLSAPQLYIVNFSALPSTLTPPSPLFIVVIETVVFYSEEITTQRDMNLPSDGGTSLATFLTNALPQTTSNNSPSSSQSDSRCSSTNGNSNSNNTSNTSNGMLPQVCRHVVFFGPWIQRLMKFILRYTGLFFPPQLSSGEASSYQGRSGSFLPNPIGKPLSQSSSLSNCLISDSQPTYHKAPGSEREDKEVIVTSAFRIFYSKKQQGVVRFLATKGCGTN